MSKRRKDSGRLSMTVSTVGGAGHAARLVSGLIAAGTALSVASHAGAAYVSVAQVAKGTGGE